MEENQNSEPINLISEKEINQFQANYRERFKAEFLETFNGQKLIALQGLGLGVSIDQIIDRYIDLNGETFSVNGQLEIDELSINELCQIEYLRVSRATGLDFTRATSITAVQKAVDEIHKNGIIEQPRGNVQTTAEIFDKENNDNSSMILDSDKNVIFSIMDGIASISYDDGSILNIDSENPEFIYETSKNVVGDVPLTKEEIKSISDSLNSEAMRVTDSQQILDEKIANAEKALEDPITTASTVKSIKEEAMKNGTFIDPETLDEAVKASDQQAARLFISDDIEVEFLTEAGRIFGALVQNNNQPTPELLERLENLYEDYGFEENKFFDQILSKGEDGKVDYKKFLGNYGRFLIDKRKERVAYKVREHANLEEKNLSTQNGETLKDIITIVATAPNYLGGNEYDDLALEQFLNKIGIKDFRLPDGRIDRTKFDEFIDEHRGLFEKKIQGFPSDLEKPHEISAYYAKKAIPNGEYYRSIKEHGFNRENYEYNTSFKNRDEVYLAMQQSALRAARIKNIKMQHVYNQIKESKLKPEEVLELYASVLIDEHREDNDEKNVNWDNISEHLNQKEISIGKESQMILNYMKENIGEFKQYFTEDGRFSSYAGRIVENFKSTYDIDTDWSKVGDAKNSLYERNNQAYSVYQKNEAAIKKICQKIQECKERSDKGENVRTELDMVFASIEDGNKEILSVMDSKALTVLADLDSNRFNKTIQPTLDMIVSEDHRVNDVHGLTAGIRRNVNKFNVIFPLMVKNKEIRNHYTAVMYNKVLKGLTAIGDLTVNKNRDEIDKIHVFKFLKPRELPPLSEDATKLISMHYDLNSYKNVYKDVVQKGKTRIARDGAIYDPANVEKLKTVMSEKMIPKASTLEAKIINGLHDSDLATEKYMLDYEAINDRNNAQMIRQFKRIDNPLSRSVGYSIKRLADRFGKIIGKDEESIKKAQAKKEERQAKKEEERNAKLEKRNDKIMKKVNKENGPIQLGEADSTKMSTFGDNFYQTIDAPTEQTKINDSNNMSVGKENAADIEEEAVLE